MHHRSLFTIRSTASGQSHATAFISVPIYFQRLLKMVIAVHSFALAVLFLAEFGRSFAFTRTMCKTPIRSHIVKNDKGMTSMSPLRSSNDGSQERTFANYVIYKRNAAVGLKIIPPTFQLSGTKSRTVSREGGLFFEFALSAGPKEYDWTKKGTFLLSVAECGELLLFDVSRPTLEFFHDPNMGSANAGRRSFALLYRSITYQPCTKMCSYHTNRPDHKKTEIGVRRFVC